METICAKNIGEYGELIMIDLTTDNIRTIALSTGFIKDNVEISFTSFLSSYGALEMWDNYSQKTILNKSVHYS